MNYLFYVRALLIFRNQAKRIAMVVALTAAGAAIGLMQAWPFAILIDCVLAKSSTDDWLHHFALANLPRDPSAQIIALAGITLALKLAQDLIQHGRQYVQHRVNYGGLMHARCMLFEKLQVLSASYYKSVPQGDIIYRLTNDCNSFQGVLGVFLSVFVSTVTLLIIGVILYGRAPGLTLLALAIAIPLTVVNVWFAKRFNQSSMHVRKADTAYTTFVQRSLTSLPLVQAYCREQDTLTNYRGTCHSISHVSMQYHREETAYRLVVGFLFGISGTVVFAYGAHLALNGKMTVGDLTVFMAYLGMLYDPVCKLTGASASLQSSLCSVQRVFEVLDTPCSIADSADAIPLKQRPQKLELANVHFEYCEGFPVLKNLCATIRHGEMIGFVGPSGAGKSTLLHLFPRFYDPTSGVIRLDGVDMRKVRLKDLRRHIALVSQETLLLPTSVFENIAFGRPDATLKEVERAAEMAGIAEFINSLPEKYDTVLADGGQNLSGGQRQRLAIARGLLSNASILVLDEPTSALDAFQETGISQTLAALRGERTIIIVSHRLSVVAACDQIIVLNRGEIAESGTHSKLLKDRGLYARLAVAQA